MDVFKLAGEQPLQKVTDFDGSLLYCSLRYLP